MSDLQAAITRIGKTLSGVVVGQETLAQQLLVALLAGVVMESGNLARRR